MCGKRRILFIRRCLGPGLAVALVACGGAGDSSTSGRGVPEVTGGDSSPSHLIAFARGPQEIHLTWEDNSLEKYFVLERRTEGAEFATVPNFPEEPDITSWIDTGVKAVTTYFYRIRAVCKDGVSDWEEMRVGVTTPALRLSAGSEIIPFHWGSLSRAADGSINVYAPEWGSLECGMLDGPPEKRSYLKFDLTSVDVAGDLKISLCLTYRSAEGTPGIYPDVLLKKIPDYGDLGEEDWDLSGTTFRFLSIMRGGGECLDVTESIVGRSINAFMILTDGSQRVYEFGGGAAPTQQPRLKWGG